MVYVGLINGEIKVSGSDEQAVNDGAVMCGLALDTIEETDRQVITGWDGKLYFDGEEPAKPLELRTAEVKNLRAALYARNIDPLMAEYNRKKQFNLFEDGEEAALLAEIEAKAADIRNNNPYPEV